MIDDYLREIGEAGLDRTLDDLEADIWRRLAVRSQYREVARRRVSLQSLVMVIGLIGSIAGGINAARPAIAAHGRVVLTLGSDLAPSSLLLGHTP